MSTDISGLILKFWPLIGLHILGLILIGFSPQDPILTVQYLQTAPLNLNLYCLFRTQGQLLSFTNKYQCSFIVV